MDILATDLAVTALAERALVESDDEALRLLEAWAADIDAHPIAVDVDAPAAPPPRRTARGAVRSIAVMTLALTLSSTGIAAAVQGNPLGPINFVVDKFGHFTNHDRAPSVDLGSRLPPPSQRAEEQARMRADQKPRPSRSRPEHSVKPATAAAPVLGPPIEVRRVPQSGATGEPARPRERQRPLVVRHPHADRPVSPRPGGGQTPPERPEVPPVQSSPWWPKPIWVERPAPPDKPVPYQPESAPVR